MLDKKLEAIYFIRDEILTLKDVDAITIWDAARLATEDDYLYEMLNDWMKETDVKNRFDILNEVIDYTSEMRKRLGNKSS